MAGLSDTSPEAQRVLIEALRKMPAARKWHILGETYRTGRTLHAAGVRLRNPTATPQEINDHWLSINFGLKPAGGEVRPAWEGTAYNLADLREVLTVLTGLDIPYALGGSMAASVHGVIRYANDADVTADPFPGQEARLVAAFRESWQVSESAVCDALRRRTSFNLVKPATGFKVDVFVRKDRPFEISAMGRRIPINPDDAPDHPIMVYTPEDVILFKLAWFRLGNESSEQQLRDILGVLQVQAGRLDDAYLDHWAADLGVADLLARARREAAGA